MSFDPNAAADHDSGIFGLNDTEAQSQMVYLPVPWEATTSYGGGTSRGPSAILKASHQLDLFDAEIEKPYLPGLHWILEKLDLHTWSETAKSAALNTMVSGSDPAPVNELSEKLNAWVYTESKRIILAGKTLGIVGGDHSAPLGGFKAIAEAHPEFGILHFDAHMDLRKAYQGFQYSHASIMYNALTQIPELKSLVQVGIRDFCEQEFEFSRAQKGRVSVFYDAYLNQMKNEGKTWDALCQKMIKPLPKNVWISFDIDGLTPTLCPNTGTPVPGGLEFNEAVALIRALAKSGRTIIGFDLCEVTPSDDLSNEWDANVAMRLLYKMTAWTLFSQGKLKELER